MEIKTIKDLVCLVDGTTLEKFLYNAKFDSKDEINITTIRKNCFKNVSSVEYLSIKTNSSLIIDESAFENSSKLKTVVLENGSNDLVIQSDAFKSCNELDCVHIKTAGKIIIEKNVFAQCYNLRVVILESGNVEIRDDAFESSNDLCIISQSNDDVEKYCSEHNFEYKDLNNEQTFSFRKKRACRNKWAT
jgi:hypothetical protein